MRTTGYIGLLKEINKGVKYEIGIGFVPKDWIYEDGVRVYTNVELTEVSLNPIHERGSK